MNRLAAVTRASRGARWLLPWLGLFALLAALLGGGCGGVGTEGTGSFASGPINGFGSIVVGGIRFDQSAAAVVDEAGQARDRGELALGMVVEVEAGPLLDDAAGTRASAGRVRITSELAGVVDQADPLAGTLQVMGRTVQVAAGTVFDPSLPGGLTKLAPGMEVEIFGNPVVSASAIAASRIALAPPGGLFKSRGVIGALDTASLTFRIDGTTYDFAAASGTPPALADGDMVRLLLQRSPDAKGRWPVVAFLPAVPMSPDRASALIEGAVTRLASAADFAVNGVPVDATRAAFRNGVPALGQMVGVRGQMSGGVLTARVVEIRSDAELNQFQFGGVIESLDMANQTLTLAMQPLPIDFAGTVEYLGGLPGELAIGRRIQVRGVLAAQQTRLQALSIRFLN